MSMKKPAEDAFFGNPKVLSNSPDMQDLADLFDRVAMTYATDAAFISADLSFLADGTTVGTRSGEQVKVNGATVGTAGSIKTGWEPVQIESLANFKASKRGYAIYSPGDRIIIGQYPYDVVSAVETDYDLITDDGVLRIRLARCADGTIAWQQAGCDEAATDNAVAIDLAIKVAQARAFGAISGGGAFKTSGGHMFHALQQKGVSMTGTRFDHIDSPTIAGTYSQVAGTTITVDAVGHGLVANKSVYLTFNTGVALDGLFTVDTVIDADHFTVEFQRKGDHDGADGASELNDASQNWPVNGFVNMVIQNTTDGSEGVITANTATEITATLAGGSNNVWNDGDEYEVVATTSGTVTVDPKFVCFKAVPDGGVGDFVERSGLTDLTIACTRTSGNGVALLSENYGHLFTDNWQPRDYDGPLGFGLLCENSNERWSESQVHNNIRVTNCKHHITYRQNHGVRGTSSFAYSKMTGTLSESPVGARNFHVGHDCSIYSNHHLLNIYMASDAAAVAVDIQGSLKHGVAFFSGEKPGASGQTAFRTGPMSELREILLHAVFQNGAIELHPNTTMTAVHGMIASTTQNVFIPLQATSIELFKKQGNQSIPSGGAWTTVTGFNATDSFRRPSGEVNFDRLTGVYTLDQPAAFAVAAKLFVTASTNDDLRLRVMRSDGKAWLLDKVPTHVATEYKLAGSEDVFGVAGQTFEVQASSVNGATIEQTLTDIASTISWKLIGN